MVVLQGFRDSERDTIIEQPLMKKWRNTVHYDISPWYTIS